MFEELWQGIMELTAQFVIPDWGALIALLPIFVVILIVAVLVWIFLGLWHAAPARRGKRRIEPRTPAGIHMPGPSWAPVLAAIGAAMLFLGIVFGGTLLIAGAIAMTITLLYWLVEALRIYDHDVGPAAPGLPAVIHDGPPEGVHMPGPLFRPFLGAIGATMLMLGLVFGGWLLAAGVIALIATLVGWLTDARKEYVKTVEADTTGHLENIPAPRTPGLMLVGLGALLVGAVVIQVGWVPPREANGGGGPAPSGAPAASGEAPAGSGGPEASEAPPGGPAADITVTALDLAFTTTEITGPAGKPFTIAFDNQDAGVPHNIEIKDAAGAAIWVGEIFNGVETRVYDVPAIPAGTYPFLCAVHPTMTGTATLE